MRKLLLLWLLGWALFGFPWMSFQLRPRFYRANLNPFRRSRRRDELLNFAYYVPLGVILVVLGWAPALATGAAVGLSALTEFLQIFSADRYPSASDLLLNIAGAIAGIAAASVVRTREKSFPLPPTIAMPNVASCPRRA